jgi:regulatory protein
LPKSDLGAFDRSLLILAGRPHSAVELGRKLRQRGHEAEEVEAALARLRDLGYLDDRAFAESLVGWRSSSRGRRAMASELAARGVSRAVAQEVLGALDPESELEAARRLAARDRGNIPRAAARLRRRGFSEDSIRAALREIDLEFTSAG